MSIEIETKSDFKITCEKCGNELNARLGGCYSWSRDAIIVEPCETCIESAKEEGREEGGAA